MVQELSSHECVCYLQLVNLIETLSIPKAHSQCTNKLIVLQELI